MYALAGRDKVIELLQLPQMEPGAPCPLVISSEHGLVVSYWAVETKPPADYGPTVPVAFLVFHRPYAHQFGPPNEEAITSHPLASVGLHPYGCFRIHDSSWIFQLEKMNSVHRYHSSEPFRQMKHYAVVFHDSTFECIAHGLTASIREIHQNDVLPAMVDLLREEDPSQRKI
jgi:hypothetical protein